MRRKEGALEQGRRLPVMKNFIVHVGARDRKILATSAYNAVVVAYPHLTWAFQERCGEAYKFHTTQKGKRYPASVTLAK